MCIDIDPPFSSHRTTTTVYLSAESMERYTIGKQIGEGSFGNVFLAVKNDTNEKVNPSFCGSFLFGSFRIDIDTDTDIDIVRL